MRKLTQVEVNEIIKLHGLWLKNKEGGYRADFSNCDLSRLILSYANLSGADLIDANLSDANLSDANLSGADLSYADLSDANLSGANLSGADLSYADLRGANLSDADLSYANLRGANLIGAIGNMSEIKSMQIDVYSIAYTFHEMQIGCQKHTIDRWKGFTDKEIEGMEGDKALRFWKKYKDFIFMAIELSPAVPTK